MEPLYTSAFFLASLFFLVMALATVVVDLVILKKKQRARYSRDPLDEVRALAWFSALDRKHRPETTVIHNWRQEGF